MKLHMSAFPDGTTKIIRPRLPACPYRAHDAFRQKVAKAGAKWEGAILTDDNGVELMLWESRPAYCISSKLLAEAKPWAGGLLWVSPRYPNP